MKSKFATIKFLEYDCEIIISRYKGGQNYLQLVDTQDNSPVAVASVNLPDEKQEPNEIFIKNWAENAGIMEALMLQRIITGPLESIPTGFTVATRHELLI
jgi:hypothetical protein